jgi:hypothetical protein
MTQELRLHSAHTDIVISCADALIADWLQQQYAAFLAPPQMGPVFRVAVEMHHDWRPESVAWFDPRYDGSSGAFTAPGAVGQINSATRTARVQLSSHQPRINVETFLRLIYALLAFEQGGLLLHAAAVVYAERVALFLGHSGRGKTTLSRLSRAAGHRVLNDDLVLLLPAGDGWNVVATPFWNISQVGAPTPGNAPLHALFCLAHTPDVFLTPVSQAAALAEVVACVPVIARESQHTPALLTWCSRLVQCLPMQRLHFRPDASFLDVIVPYMQHAPQ